VTRRYSAQSVENMTAGRHGERIDLDLLLRLIQPEIDRVGLEEFCLCAHISPRQLYAIRTHEYLCRFNMADRLLTNGMGRPDLVALVCPDVPT
jgi:hypothetical protein